MRWIAPIAGLILVVYGSFGLYVALVFWMVLASLKDPAHRRYRDASQFILQVGGKKKAEKICYFVAGIAIVFVTVGCFLLSFYFKETKRLFLYYFQLEIVGNVVGIFLLAVSAWNFLAFLYCAGICFAFGHRDHPYYEQACRFIKEKGGIEVMRRDRLGYLNRTFLFFAIAVLLFLIT